MISARGGGGRRALAGAIFAALLISVLSWSAPVSPASAAGHWLESSPSADAAEFWTQGRVRRAVPLELGTGPGFKSAPGTGGDFGSDFEQVPDPTTPESRVHGVVLLGLGIFGYGRCSGTAVRSPNKSVVITAAHCLNAGEDDDWFPGEAVFIPAYRFGQRPFGVFPVRWIDTTKGWRATDGSPNYDVGAMVVGRNGSGKLLGDAVGGAKIAWNLKRNQSFAVHGYPAEEPFDGETQRICGATSYFGHDPHSVAYPGPLNLAVSCGVTGGASGGGWLIDGDTLNGVTSYGYFDEESPDYGPYFGKEVARLYGRAARVR